LWMVLLAVLLSAQTAQVEASGPEYPPTEILSFADELYRRGDFPSARMEYERFLFRFPDHAGAPEAQVGKARCLFWMGAYNAALEGFKQLARDHPETPVGLEAALMTARCYFIIGETHAAAALYERMIQQSALASPAYRAHFDLGWMHLKESRWSEARKHFEHTEAESPLAFAAERLSAQLTPLPELERKSPQAAGVLSGILPGAGQLYCGQPKDAALAFFLNAVFIFASYQAFQKDMIVLGGFLSLVEMGLYGGNIYNAVNHAHKANQRTQEEYLRSLWQASKLTLKLPYEEEKWYGLMLHIRF